MMNSIAASEIGLVAVGASGSAAAVWLSPDGLNWTRVPHDEAVLGDGLMRSVAAYGGGFVAVGSDDSGGDADAAVWLSPDGLNWTRVPHDEAVFGGGGHEFMTSVASFDGGLVAVGRSDGLERSGSAVWTSPDGRAWARILRDAPIFEDAGTVDVAPFGGRLVAVGFDWPSGDADAAVWLSPDGLNWTRVPRDKSVFGGDGDQIMVSVAGFDEGLVAVGFDQGGLGDAAVWTSRDALTWTRVPHDESIFGGGEGGGAQMTAVEAFDEGLVAVGDDQVEGDIDAVVWTTSDGLTWKRVSSDESIFGGDGAQSIASLAVVDGNVIAVGLQAPSNRNLWTNPDAAVWRLTP